MKVTDVTSCLLPLIIFPEILKLTIEVGKRSSDTITNIIYNFSRPTEKYVYLVQIIMTTDLVNLFNGSTTTTQINQYYDHDYHSIPHYSITENTPTQYSHPLKTRPNEIKLIPHNTNVIVSPRNFPRLSLNWVRIQSVASGPRHRVNLAFLLSLYLKLNWQPPLCLAHFDLNPPGKTILYIIYI